MKSLIVLIFATALVVSVRAQHQSVAVPQAVKTAFAKMYPDVKTVEWEAEGKYYEAEWEQNGKESSVVFDNAGGLIENETEITFDELPANAKSYIQKNYKGKKVKEVEKSTNAKGVVMYEVEIEGKDLEFDSTGKFLKFEAEDEAGDKDEKKDK
jgi:hypothetical protein